MTEKRCYILDLKNILLDLEVMEEYQLDIKETMVYSIIYNHCKRINAKYEKSYFGYGNTILAERMNVTTRTISKILKRLQDLHLIRIENGDNQDRLIYIVDNPKEEQAKEQAEIESLNEQLKAKDDEIKRLVEKVESMQKQMEELTKQDPAIETIKTDLVASGIYATNEKIDYDLLNVYKRFINKHDMSLLESHFKYIAKHVDFSTVASKKNYLMKSIYSFDKAWQKAQLERAETVSEGVSLPAYFDEPQEEYSQEELDELLKQALECQSRVDEPINEPLEDIDETDYNAI